MLTNASNNTELLTITKTVKIQKPVIVNNNLTKYLINYMKMLVKFLMPHLNFRCPWSVSSALAADMLTSATAADETWISGYQTWWPTLFSFQIYTGVSSG